MWRSFIWVVRRCLMAEGRVTYAQEDRWHVLRYVGRVDYTLAPAIDRFVQGLFAADGGRSTIVSTDDDINDVLTSMGFAEIFDILPELPYKTRGDCEEMVTGD